jgi:hypothetical protein
MNKWIEQKTGFREVRFIMKPFDEKEILFDCIEKRKKIVENIEPITTVEVLKIADKDIHIAQIIYDELKVNFKFCNHQIFMKVGNIWIKEKEQIENYLLNYIQNSKIYKMSGD